MKKMLYLIVAVALCFSLVSCATMFDDDTSAIVIDSTPSDATVRVDGFPMGTTPVTLNLDSSSSHTIEISKDGYKSELATVKKNIRWGWQILDIFTTGLIGNIVDLVTPNGYKLSPDRVYFELQSK